MTGESLYEPDGGLFTVIYLIILLLGIACLFPWNAYLKAISYFGFVLKGSHFQDTYPSYITSTYTLSQTFGMILLVVLKDYMYRNWSSEKPYLDTSKKIYFGLFGNLILISIMSLFPILHYHKMEPVLSGNLFFTFLLTIMTLTGLVTSILMKGLFEMIALLPMKFTSSFIGGQAVAGVLASFISLISTVNSGGVYSMDTYLKSTIGYFVIATVILGSSFVAFLWFRQSDLFKHRVSNHQRSSSLEVEKDRVDACHADISFIQASKFVLDLAFGVFATLSGTLTLISSCIPSVKSVSLNQDGLWARSFVATVFLTYDLGDLSGRWLPCLSFIKFRRRSLLPVLLPWFRILTFIPIFLMSNLGNVSSTFRSIVPMLITNDLFYLAIVFVFGLTNGYCCTTLMLLTPDRGSRRFVQFKGNGATGVDECRALVGSVMGLFINFGLVAGSLASFALRALFTGSNPFGAPKRQAPSKSSTPTKKPKEDQESPSVTYSKFKNLDYLTTKGDQKRKKWKNLKQILDLPSTFTGPAGFENFTYLRIEAPPSCKPIAKYCDITGLNAPYTDPKTGLRYHSSEVFQYIRTLSPETAQRILQLRNAGTII